MIIKSPAHKIMYLYTFLVKVCKFINKNSNRFAIKTDCLWKEDF